MKSRRISGSVQHISGNIARLHAWFTRLAEQTQEGLLRQPEHFTLIHGDFSLDQVVQSDTDNSQLFVLDWDRAAQGNPLMDLATFQARLELQVIEGVLPHWQATKLLAISCNITEISQTLI